VLFRSNKMSLSERTSLLFILQDPDPSITSNLSVQRVSRNGSSVSLTDSRFPPTRRFFHAARGTTNVDVFVDDDFSAPVAGDLAYGAVSADVAVPAGDSNYTFTQAGNMGAIVHEEEDSAAGNSRSTAFLAGAPGDVTMLSARDDRRPIAGLARLRITLISENIEQADLWLLKAGTALADSNPTLPAFGTGNTSGYLQFQPGSYELTVTFGDDDTVAAGPFPLDLAKGDAVELVVIDTADPNVLDIVVYDP
jgi:hypothetical protein